MITQERIDKAVDRAKFASELSLAHYHKPLIVTYSGGKDSDVLVEIFRMAQVPFVVANSHTTVDAPETVYHIRKRFAELEEQGVKCHVQMPKLSMWQLIQKNGMPPTQTVRYCCKALKESNFENSMIATGIRWDESVKRSKRSSFEVLTAKSKDRINTSMEELEGEESQIMLSNDNDKKRQFVERCKMRAKTVCNPIIDWTTSDIWDFINQKK